MLKRVKKLLAVRTRHNVNQNDKSFIYLIFFMVFTKVIFDSDFFKLKIYIEKIKVLKPFFSQQSEKNL